MKDLIKSLLGLLLFGGIVFAIGFGIGRKANVKQTGLPTDPPENWSAYADSLTGAQKQKTLLCFG